MKNIEKLYSQGYSLSIISKLTGMSVNQLEYLVYRQMKLPAKYKNRPKLKDLKPSIMVDVFHKYPTEKIERIIKLTNFGYEPCEISEDQGISTLKIKQIILQAEQMNRIRKII